MLSFLVLFFFIGFLDIAAQSLEVEGNLKVTVMDTLNDEKLLVVKQSDGTLAARSVNSLPQQLDTIRSLQSDLMLTAALCNCSSIPPAMITSLLNNGYDLEDLVGFQVGITDLLDYGYTIQELFNEGAGAQAFLDIGYTPFGLFSLGMPLDSIYGSTYKGGLIYYLDTIDGSGLVASPIDHPYGKQFFGCNDEYSGGNYTDITYGKINTQNIASYCGGPYGPSVAETCELWEYNGYSDWFLPSRDELVEMHAKIGPGATSSTNMNIGNFLPTEYWSSSEVFSIVTVAYGLSFQSANQTPFIMLKSSLRQIRPSRSFSQ